jgi:hypothetical protein
VVGFSGAGIGWFFLNFGHLKALFLYKKDIAGGCYSYDL